MNRLGLGDLLILKVWSKHHNTQEDITIYRALIRKYRCDDPDDKYT